MQYLAIDSTLDEPGLGGKSEKAWDENVYETRKTKVSNAWSDTMESTVDDVPSEAAYDAMLDVSGGSQKYDTLVKKSTYDSLAKGGSEAHSPYDTLKSNASSHDYDIASNTGSHHYEVATSSGDYEVKGGRTYEKPVGQQSSVQETSLDVRRDTVFLKPNKELRQKPVLQLDMLG